MLYPDHGKKIDDVLKAADAALYESKAGGRNRVTLARGAVGQLHKMPHVAT